MKKTIIVVGAGSSKDIYDQFPSGIELLKLIDRRLVTHCHPENSNMYHSDAVNLVKELLNKCDDDTLFDLSVPEQWRSTFNDVLVEFKQIIYQNVVDYEDKVINRKKPAPISIDAIIEQKPLYSFFAKSSILYYLLGFEGAFNSTLGIDYNDDDWVKLLVQCSKAKTRQEFEEHYYFVSFNYDRMLQVLLRRNLDDKFGPSSEPDEGINIRYVYGALGPLANPNIEKVDFMNLPFGHPNNDITPDMLANFRLAEERAQMTYNSAYEKCERVCFLGFGFDNLNIKALIKLGVWEEGIAKRSYFSSNTMLDPEIQDRFRKSKSFQFVGSCKETIAKLTEPEFIPTMSIKARAYPRREEPTTQWWQ